MARLFDFEEQTFEGIFLVVKFSEFVVLMVLLAENMKDPSYFMEKTGRKRWELLLRHDARN